MQNARTNLTWVGESTECLVIKKILNPFFRAANALSINAQRFEWLRLKSSLIFSGKNSGDNSLRCYLVDMKGGRNQRQQDITFAP
jgi:hypothetical protein